jgi:phage terminase large subunit-like protein
MPDPDLERLLGEYNDALAYNPLLGYNDPDLKHRLHRKQIIFHEAMTKVKALIAGNRSGKTVGCIVDDIIQAVDRGLLPAWLKPFKKWEPPFHVWIGAPKFSKHEDTIIPLLRRFLPKQMLFEGSFEKSYRRQPTPILRLTNGSTFTFKTYDQDLDAWAGAAVNRIHWDEEPNGEDGKALRGEAQARLVSTDGDEIIGMTPLLGLGTWVYDEIWERRHEPGITVVQMSIGDNPWNTKKAIEEFLAGRTDEERRAREKGEFVHFGGLFYDEFSDDLHVWPTEAKPEHVKGQDVVVGIDPGLRRTGITWTAFDNDNAALTFDEYYPSESVVPEICAEIRQRNEYWGCEDPLYIIDPSARNRSAINADAIEAAYMREGIYPQYGQNDRGAGIMEIKRRLQACDGQGEPHPTLVISPKCQNLIWEIGRYRRDTNSDDEWKAIKVDDHLVDSLRYAILHRTWYVSPLPAQKPVYSTPEFQAPHAEEKFRQDVPPLGAFS